jgi:hypothetical protein
MNEDTVVFFFIGTFSLLLAIFGLTVIPNIARKNWHSRSEKIEKLIIGTSKVGSILGMLASISMFVLGIISIK